MPHTVEGSDVEDGQGTDIENIISISQVQKRNTRKLQATPKVTCALG